jgi:hypothetical protein
MRYPARRRHNAAGCSLDAKRQIQRGALKTRQDLREVRGANANDPSKLVALGSGRLEVCRELFHAPSFIYQLNIRQVRTLAIRKFRWPEPFAIQEEWL